ncbi:MAG: hypothetical protein K8R87_04095 [Verrucomicrobia bacterium]|nr:hypothetical protein [Verrucomicrobiota bacterium]
MAGMIRRAYAPEEGIPAHTVRELIALPPEEIPRYRCYTGHFFSLLRPLVGRDLPTITVLREPFAHTMSLIRHCQRREPQSGWRAPLAARAAHFLWDWFPPARRCLERLCCPVVMNNFQTRVLGCEIEHPGNLNPDFYGLTYPFLHHSLTEPPVDMEVLLERAKSRLREMVVVGTVERFEETVRLVFEHLGVPMPAEIPRDNVNRSFNKRSQGRDGVSRAFASLIDRETIYDRALYQYAQELLEAQIKRGGVE